MAKMIPLKWRSSVEQLRQNISDAFARLVSKFKREESEDGEFWAPTVFESTAQGVELDERDDAIIATAMLPSLGKNDFKVEVTEDRLVVRGGKSRSSKKKGRDYARYEENYASFAQAISLPCEIDRNRVKANFKRGRLTITLPKSERARSKRIKVMVSN